MVRLLMRLPIRLPRRLLMRLPGQLSRLVSYRAFSVVVVSLLLLLLTIVFQQTQTLNIDQHYRIVSHLRSLERNDLAIMNDAFKTQLSVLKNYDPLVADRARFHTELTALKQALSVATDDFSGRAYPLEQQLKTLDRKEQEISVLIEDFKSEHAVLQNSVSYFPKGIEALIKQLRAQKAAPELEPLLTQLFTAFLRYNLTPSLEGSNEVNQLLAQINNLPISLSDDWQQPIAHIIRHAEAILRLQPGVNLAISRLADADVEKAINQLALGYEAYHRQAVQIQNRYRLGLYLVAILLTLLSLYFVWNRHNAAVLRKVNRDLSHVVSERTQALQTALEQLKKSQSQLIQAEKMSALGQLSAGIAHEINNPINFIHGNVRANEQYSLDCLELLALYEQHYPKPAEDIQDLMETIDLNFLRTDWQKLLDSISLGTTRVKQIVESLRNFSRLDEAGCKAVDLNQGLENTLILLNHRLVRAEETPPINVIKHYGELPLVQCDPSATNQVFMNILSNAIDALSSGHMDPTIVITTRTEEGYAVVTIADNGEGIPESIQSKIFDPFFTSKPVGQGTGLGLTVSYQTIVEAHQGLLDMVSAVGEGSEFQIRLPLRSDDLE